MQTGGKKADLVHRYFFVVLQRDRWLFVEIIYIVNWNDVSHNLSALLPPQAILCVVEHSI